VAFEVVLAGIGCGWRGAGNGVGNAAVEALDHTVGLGMEGPGEPMGDAMVGADAIEGMLAGRRLSLWPPSGTPKSAKSYCN